MNERIRLLAVQAEGTKKHVPAVWQFYDHELEKFAQLIVRECAGLTLDYRNPDHYRGWLEYRDKIKKHFGVEE